MMATTHDEHIARCESDVRIAEQRVIDAKAEIEEAKRALRNPQESWRWCECKAQLKVAQAALSGCELELEQAAQALYNARHG